ncbi:MAG: putative Fe-S cluster assembly protein SufT [Zetaproteobacteria bacterium]|nr:MAG: putative Fe-S cluster assembly protein SufT [Zetaproteobacteria bacterium]
MNSGRLIAVKRDVDAVLVPLGTPIVIPAGSQVRITQELGGSYTVAVGGNLARIEGKDADALGLDEQEPGASGAAGSQQAPDGEVDMNEVWRVLKTCFDPEIPVNIVDLGLVYDVHVVATDDGGNEVDVVMTLTAPGCGMGPFIVEDVRRKLLELPNVTEVHVELVFDPPWDRSRMTDEAKLQLGMF